MARREIVVVGQAFTPEELELLVEQLGQLTLEAGAVGSSGACDDTKRVAQVAWLDHDEQSTWLYRKLMTYVQSANVFFGLKLWGIAEHLQYAEYGLGGHYCWHRDNGIDPDEPPRPPRKVSFSLQLSQPDDYEGGVLEIMAADTEPQTKAFGALILFPSFVTHRVTPVTAGKRKALVGWACGEDYA